MKPIEKTFDLKDKPATLNIQNSATVFD